MSEDKKPRFVIVETIDGVYAGELVYWDHGPHGRDGNHVLLRGALLVSEGPVWFPLYQGESVLTSFRRILSISERDYNKLRGVDSDG